MIITKFNKFLESSFANVEVTPNNTSGFAGDTSSTRDSGGYMRSGNDHSFGITFTPKGEKDDINKSYKYRKRKKKIFKKNKKYDEKKDK